MNVKFLLVWLSAAFFALLTFGSQHKKDDEAEVNPSFFHRTPYVQLATPHSIYVVWRTETSSIPVVRFGKVLDKLDGVVSGSAISIATGDTNKNHKLPAGARRLHSAPLNCWQYEALISGLEPYCLYYYAVYDGEKRLTPADSSYHFRTQPVAGSDTPVRFWVVGDSGTGRENQSSIQAAMAAYVVNDNHPLDLYLHVGDMAYNRGRDAEFQSRFFEMYDSTLRNVVCWPAMGNHEGITSRGTNGVGPYYDAYVLPSRGEAGGLASGTEAYYSFDQGRVHFICLDSHDLDRKPTGAMARWLKADLEQTQADWVLAYFHHPCYTKGSHDSDREKQMVEMRTHILPILESGGVDIVFTGHSHIYERSMLIDGAYATPTVAENCVLDDREGDPTKDGPYQKSAGLHPNEGAVQIVCGNGGTTVRRRGTMPVMKKIIVEHGSVLVDIKGDTLNSIMLNKYGEVRDHFGIVKRSVVSPTRITYPLQPAPWKAAKGPDGKDPPPEPPEDYVTAIPRNADWHYLPGVYPEENWNKLDYDDSTWKIGAAAFGYGYKEARTHLDDMQGNYTVVYFRHEFEIEHADYLAEIGLMISFDDGFIAYLNGKEVARSNIEKNGKQAKIPKSRDANGKYAYYPLKEFEKALKDGKNVLCIEGHNAALESHDFLMDAFLIYED
jgi:hypothetical protein